MSLLAKDVKTSEHNYRCQKTTHLVLDRHGLYVSSEFTSDNGMLRKIVQVENPMWSEGLNFVILKAVRLSPDCSGGTSCMCCVSHHGLCLKDIWRQHDRMC